MKLLKNKKQVLNLIIGLDHLAAVVIFLPSSHGDCRVTLRVPRNDEIT
jgi:hypothetical protein